jgi:FAD synthase
MLLPGIYGGYARVDKQVFKGVMSIGYNPYFGNKMKTMVIFRAVPYFMIGSLHLS